MVCGGGLMFAGKNAAEREIRKNEILIAINLNMCWHSSSVVVVKYENKKRKNNPLSQLLFIYIYLSFSAAGANTNKNSI